MPLRLATLADVPLLVRHRRGMWLDIGGYTPAELDAADPVYARWVRKHLRAGSLVAWVVEARGAPVASGALWIQVVQPPPGTRRARRPTSSRCTPTLRTAGGATPTAS